MTGFPPKGILKPAQFTEAPQHDKIPARDFERARSIFLSAAERTRWQLGSAGQLGSIVTVQQVSQAKGAFLAAVERASCELSRQAETAMQRSPGMLQLLRGYLSTHLASAAALLLCAGLLVCAQGSRSTRALDFAGLRGRLEGLQASPCSGGSSSGLPVALPGIEIYRILQATPETGARKLVARSDCRGSFAIPPEQGVSSDDYVLVYRDRQVGAFSTDSGGGHLSRYRQLALDFPLLRLQTRSEIDIEPGQTARLGETLRVSLDSEAGQAWHGCFIEDGRWPECILFSRVAGGIFQLAGPACDGLRVSTFISQDILRYLKTQPVQLHLIARPSAGYARDVRRAADTWRNGLRQGWQTASCTAAGIVPQAGLTVEASECSPFQRAGAWVSWTARPGTPYAVVALPELGAAAGAGGNAG